MNGERGFNPENSKEAELQEIQRKIDSVVGQLIDNWNADKGWSLTMLSEKEQGYLKDQGEVLKGLNKANEDLHSKKVNLAELGKKFFKFGKSKLEKEIGQHEEEVAEGKEKLSELSEKQKEARQIFDNQKAVLEQLLTDYHMKTRATSAIGDFEKKFPYAKIYRPSYHSMDGKTTPEDRKREEEDQVAYISDFAKMFEAYGADIYKREKK